MGAWEDLLFQVLECGLDADEVLTPELQKEILELKITGEINQFEGYKLPRVLLIGNKQIRFGGFNPDAQPRLIKKGSGQFNNRMVHEAIKVSGAVRTLNNHMLPAHLYRGLFQWGCLYFYRSRGNRK